MIRFLKNYIAYGLGAIIVGLVVLCLSYVGFIRIPKDEPLETALIFGFWWLLVSFGLHHFKYIKGKKSLLIKILVLFVISFMIFGADDYFKIPDHPIVIFLMVLFWLGVSYLFFPSFFIKYKVLILVGYGLILAYFFYLRLQENYEILYHQRAFNLLILPIPILIGIWLYEQWKWFNTIKSEKSKAELELLKSQVNPHFFFNTLNNLYALTVKHSEKAPEVILKLSDMMRYTIYEGKNERVKLSEEITYLKNYIALHEIRHQKNVSIQFEHHVLPDDEIAPLLFIILLENAFKHGVEKLTNGAYVQIKLYSDQKQIHFFIENNFDDSESEEEKGIGLENLKRRLLLIYPDSHQLHIDRDITKFKVDLILKKQ
ncbi:sensor histidine kinase [Spongiimicrobium salis]|uniref:sensor histidine kinase n=1 Tax=Spongiimicrobium salis TaxID=1667022 RepID=UPI00374DA08F